MKRVLTGILTATLAVSLCAATAFAAGPRCGRYIVGEKILKQRER